MKCLFSTASLTWLGILMPSQPWGISSSCWPSTCKRCKPLNQHSQPQLVKDITIVLLWLGLCSFSLLTTHKYLYCINPGQSMNISKALTLRKSSLPHREVFQAYRGVGRDHWAVEQLRFKCLWTSTASTSHLWLGAGRCWLGGWCSSLSSSFFTLLEMP